LHVGGKQLHDLGKLSHIVNLTRLQIIEQSNVDLTPVGSLINLKSLFIGVRPRMNLSMLKDLKNLEQLTLQGFGLESLTSVTDVDVIGSLRGLLTLTLAGVNIRDVAFVSQLTNLRELNLGLMPVTSIEPLRGLSW
jgi:internalin A